MSLQEDQLIDSASLFPRRANAPNRSVRILQWSRQTLAAIVWGSSLLFGLYILAFYAAALVTGATETWNSILPGLYDPTRPAATVGIGIHFAAGGVILVLGSLQLVPAVRVRWPALHRWAGRVYVLAALLAGLGGLTFIVVKGTIGGAVMNAGFSLYGILMVLAAVQTIRHAMAGALERHRAWALRLYALAIGSWLYRMDYGFWMLFTRGLGHTSDFRGWFDRVMAFAFYLPNLALVELFIRTPRWQLPAWGRVTLAASMAIGAGFVMLGTYYFTRHSWGPAILDLITP